MKLLAKIPILDTWKNAYLVVLKDKLTKIQYSYMQNEYAIQMFAALYLAF